MSEVQLCPQARLHTPCPEGYIQWHAWAEEMSKTHKQIKCKGCGRYSIWVPKGNAMTDKDAMIEAVATDVEGTLDGLGIHLRDEPDSQQVARSIAHSAIAAIEPFMQAREQAARDEGLAIGAAEKYRTFTDGMETAAQICGSLAETTYDDADAFEAATGCEAAIMKVVREQRKEQDAIERNEHREQQDD